MNDSIEMNTHTGGGLFAGVKRTFGGGGLFVTDFTATGMGHVALQSMPIMNLAEALGRYILPQGGESSSGFASSAAALGVGGLLGGLFGGGNDDSGQNA